MIVLITVGESTSRLVEKGREKKEKEKHSPWPLCFFFFFFDYLHHTLLWMMQNGKSRRDTDRVVAYSFSARCLFKLEVTIHTYVYIFLHLQCTK